MFGGSNNSNPMLPVFTEGNHLQLDANPLPQLQLFGDFPVGCAVDPLNYMSNEQATGTTRTTKRGRGPEPTTRQQKLQISLNNNFCPDDAGNKGKFWNQNLVSTGLKLAYEEDERNSSITSAGEGMKPALLGIVSCDSLQIELDRYKEEFDHYIKLQEANLVKGIRDLRQRQTASFLNALEKGVSRKIHEKELEIKNMTRKNKELSERIKQVAMEAQSWHYRAKYNESIVNALKNNLQQQVIAQGAAKAQEGCGDSDVDDAASNTNQSLQGTPGSSGNQVICKACKVKEVCVLLMPCRHLCLCKDCDGFIDICPLCQVMRTASVQVFMS
ncbi:hypothetical protein NMG60_11019327 [Bertholletia excelsa]